MSKNDLWKNEQATTARAEGWRLVTTFDNVVRQVPRFEIARLTESSWANDRAAAIHVVSRARDGSQLHQRALHLVITNGAKQ